MCKMMRSSFSDSFLRIAFTALFILTLPYSCSFVHPRVDNSGHKQTEYQYTVPEKCEDGWEVSSLAAEGMDHDAISEMIRKVLNSYYEDIHGIVLVKNGKLVLEEYFYGYDRNKLHEMHSVTKSITSNVLEKIRDHQNL